MRLTRVGPNFDLMHGAAYLFIATRTRGLPFFKERFDTDGSFGRDDTDARWQAVRAVQIASEHPERQRIGAGIDVEEGLFLGRVALQRAHVAPRHTQLAALVEAHLADAPPALVDQAAVAAGVTAQGVLGQTLVEIAFYREGIKQGLKSLSHSASLAKDYITRRK